MGLRLQGNSLTAAAEGMRTADRNPLTDTITTHTSQHWPGGCMKKNVLLSTALKVALGAAIAVTMPLQLSHAASTDGSLAGKITASDKSSMEGVQITVRNPETGFSRTVKADADGMYR